MNIEIRLRLMNLALEDYVSRKESPSRHISREARVSLEAFNLLKAQAPTEQQAIIKSCFEQEFTDIAF